MKKELQVIFVSCLLIGQSQAEDTFTGFWKGNCSEAFGLQIMPADSSKYSVSFCGPGGCFDPGTYRPNTTIINDELYKVISDTHIQVKTRIGWNDYYKCGTDIHPELRYKECGEKSTMAKGKVEKCSG